MKNERGDRTAEEYGKTELCQKKSITQSVDPNLAPQG